MMRVDKTGLRTRTRRAVRAELTELAMEMFIERGFDETTVEDIATAAGLSKRSFFRYFPVKEDVVFGDVEDVAEQIAADLRGRPADEPAWSCLHGVLQDWEPRIHASQRNLAGLRLIEATPALRARLHHKREEMRTQITTALRERPGANLDAFTADLLTAAAAAALDATAREWLRSDGTVDRAGLLDHAFALLAPKTPTN